MNIVLDDTNQNIRVINRPDNITLRQTGKIGPTGPQGATGPSGGGIGSIGATGSTGPQGNTGVSGTDGATGIQGFTGANGSNGAQGFTGSTGPNGNTGATGPSGTNGFTGATGSQGTQGYTGSQGFTGPQGLTGVTGGTGVQGFTGVQGYTGTSGTQGFTGVQGLTGPSGVTGPTGATGANGSVGLVGGNSARYTYDTTTTSGPASGGLRVDNATDTSIANIYASSTDRNASSLTSLLNTINVGDRLRIQVDSDSSRWKIFIVSSSVVNNTTYFTIPVTFVGSSGTINNATTTSLSIATIGANGATGPTGAGNTGATGPMGNTGVQGATGSGSVTGSNTQVQYNNTGVFGASSGLVYNGTGLYIGGSLSGTNNPGQTTAFGSIDTSTNAYSGYFSQISTSGSNILAGYVARGTPGSPSATQSTDVLFGMAARGFGTSQWTTASSASIFMQATENFTNTTAGTNIIFSATVTGSLTKNTVATMTGNSITIGDAIDMPLGTTTGTKIATATTQKLGFFGMTPVVQQAAATDLATALSNLGLRAAGATFGLTTSGNSAFSGLFSVGTGGMRSNGSKRTTSSTTLVNSSAWYEILDATSNAVSITLPGASVAAGQMFIFKRIDSVTANAVTINRGGSDLIDGATSYTLASQYKYVQLQNDGGTNWYVTANN